MALDKTDISLDLVHGADTKVNSQIDTSFQKMVNVTFDGDMTAKKMKGYDLLDTLPAGEKYSLLARRQSDLIAQTDKGTYKYIKEFSKFKKISDIGSCEIISNESRGLNFAFSADYRCFVEYISDNVQSFQGRECIRFYTHENVLINRIMGNQGFMGFIWSAKTSKVLSVGNDFYIMRLENGTEQGGGNIRITLRKYSLNISTSEFEFISDAPIPVTNSPDITSIDCFADASNVYIAYSNATEKKIFKISTAMSLVTSVNITPDATGIIEVIDKDSTEFYLSTQSATDVLLTQVDKATLAQSGSVSVKSTGSSARSLIFPTSDTTAIVATFLLAPLTGFPTLCPTGKIFLRNGNYYVPALQYTGNNVASVLLQIKDSFLIPRGISDTGQVGISNPALVSVQTGYTSFMITFPSAQSFEDKDYYTTYTPSNSGTSSTYMLSSTLVSFNYDAKEKNSYIEIEKTNIVSGGLLGYFDGDTFSEYGFIGNPYISDYSTVATGSLPADTGYAFAFIYRWTDAQGNIIYSPMGPIFSGGDPVNGITLPVNSRVNFNLQNPMITVKDNVTVEVYIRRKNTLFVLAKSFDFAFTNPVVNAGTIAVSISVFPTGATKVMPYQDGSIAPEVVSNASQISLYADRIFRVSKDNPTSLAYSQRKLAQNQFEFNDSFLYLDVLDKRGIAEDNLTGCIAMDGRLIIFKETSILYMSGTGPSRANTQDDFSEPQLLVSDVGCIHPRSIILVPDGVMFKSDKGIYLLNRKLQAGYIGSNVEAFNNYTIVSAILIEKANEVRFATLEGLVLVYNYLSSAWSWFEDLNCISACLFNGKYAILKTDGQVIIETPSHNKLIDQSIIQNISSPWLRLNKIQGYQKAYYVRILGKFKTLHRLKMNVYYDYELYSSEEYIIDPLAENQYNIEIKPTNEEIENGDAINGVYQMKIDLVRKNCQSVRVVIEDIPLDVENNTGECFALSNITVNIGIKKGLAKIQASKSY